MIEAKDKIKEYVELEKKQKLILDELSLEESIDLFFMLAERGMIHERP